MSESSLIKLQALRAPTLLKGDFNTDFFQRDLQNFSEHLVLQTAASAGLRFPVCNFLKKETREKIFFL